MRLVLAFVAATVAVAFTDFGFAVAAIWPYLQQATDGLNVINKALGG